MGAGWDQRGFTDLSSDPALPGEVGGQQEEGASATGAPVWPPYGPSAFTPALEGASSADGWCAPRSFLSNLGPWCSHMSNSYPDSEQLRSGTQATPGLTCIRVRSDSTYDCSVSSRVMVTCFRISWGDRRQRVSSALFLSHAPPAVTGAQPSPRSSRSVLPKAPWTSTLQVCARVLPLQTIPLPATPSLPPQTALLNSHPSAPLSRAIGSSGDLLFTSWLPIGLLKRTQESQ